MHGGVGFCKHGRVENYVPAIGFCNGEGWWEYKDEVNISLRCACGRDRGAAPANGAARREKALRSAGAGRAEAAGKEAAAV